MDAKKFLLIGLIGLVAIICYVNAENEPSNGKPAVEKSACKHIELNRHISDKSSDGRKQFKIQKKQSYLDCRKCCNERGYIYDFFTYKAAPYQCQCANKYKYVLKAD